MILNDPALTFALTLKRWFASNGWPQKITDDWAHAVQSPTGPWASQVCNALKASGYNPKAEFFLALASFNQAIADQDLLGIKDLKLRERLTNAEPLRLENGQPYGGAEFWSLYAGLLEPPEAFNSATQLTEEDVQEWTRQVRDAFRQVCLKHMVDRGEAWEMLRERMIEIQSNAGHPTGQVHDCLDWMQEVLAGLREPTVEEAIRQAKRWEDTQPFQRAMEELLGAKKSTSTATDEKRSQASPSPFPSMRS